MYRIEAISSFEELDCDYCSRPSCKTPNGMYKVTIGTIKDINKLIVKENPRPPNNHQNNQRNDANNMNVESDDESEDDYPTVKNLCSMCCDELTKTEITSSKTIIYNNHPLHKLQRTDINDDDN